jgi:phospholipid transport system substrate-binding protein
MVILLLASILAGAHPPPEQVVRQGTAEIRKAVETPEASLAAVVRTLDRFMDVGELARRALGAEWARLKAHQRRELVVTLTELLGSAYTQKAMGQADAPLELGAIRVDGAEAEVETAIDFMGDRVVVLYRLHQTEAGAWRVYDVVTDDVSLVDAYRGQFRRVISEKGMGGLLATLKKKRQALGEPQARKGSPQ